MSTFAERAMLAYQALPRSRSGRPPSFRSLEVKHGLPRSLLSRLFSGDRSGVETATLPRLARALGVTPDWLVSGEDVAPPKTPGSEPPTRGPTLVLAEESWDRVTEAIENPPKPTDELRKIFRAAPGYQMTDRERAVVTFIRGAASVSPNREELLALARQIAAGEHVSDE